jgi:pyruvate formate lyase activating enzyme
MKTQAVEKSTPIEIKGFIETSFVDWKDKMASVIFLPNCNYRCPYCHNHRLVTDSHELTSWPVAVIFERLEKLRGWIDGVCITGGEPTLSPALFPLLKELKSKNWPVKIDTNGSKPEIIEKLIEEDLVDAFSVDVKAPLEDIAYRRNAGSGANPELVRQSLLLIANAKIDVELRTTVHPDLLSLEEIKRIALDVKTIFGPSKSLKLQQCRVDFTLDPKLSKTKTFTVREIDELTAVINNLNNNH